MEGTSDVLAVKMLNHELVKLDRFDGTNFSRWKDKMKFLLTALKLFCLGLEFDAFSYCE